APPRRPALGPVTEAPRDNCGPAHLSARPCRYLADPRDPAVSCPGSCFEACRVAHRMKGGDMNRWDPGAHPRAPESVSPGTQAPDTASQGGRGVEGATRTTDLFPEEDVFARMIDRSPKRGPWLRWAPIVLGCLAAIALVAAATLF